MLVQSPSSAQPRRGVVLLAALVVIVLLALAAYQYSDLMLAEYKASVNAHRAAQSRAFAESGVHYALALLSDPDQIELNFNGNIFDNAESFRNVSAGTDKNDKPGFFSLIAPADPDEPSATQVRYGFVDEAGKINVNALMKRDPKGDLLYQMLLKLPNVTDEIAACIADWLDADSTPRTSGAENDYYSGQTPSYRAKNGPIDSLEELLLVKGVTAPILYGNDLNHNGVQDPDEPVGDGGFDRGLSAYLTVYSREHNVDEDGRALTYINESDAAALYERLAPDITDDLAKFIVMYRQYGPSESSSNQSKQSKTDQGNTGKSKGKGGKGQKTPKTVQGVLSSFTLDFEQKASKKVDSFFDLVNAEISIPGKGKNDPTTIYKSPLSDLGLRRDLMPKLFEHATIFQESDIPARINVNTAPREVVAAIPDLSEADVQAILTLRPPPTSTDITNPIYKTPAWLLTEANLKAETLKKVEKAITARSQVYRVQSLGYYDEKGPAARIEAVIDMNGGRPRIVFWRDLTELGARRALVK